MTVRVLCTGGAGFLGRAILRRVYGHRDEEHPTDGGRWLDWDVTVYSRDEEKQVACASRYPRADYILGSVTDESRLRAVASGHDIIIHTAAIKYIPEAEHNAMEAVKTNVHGSESVMKAAMWAGIKTVVGISTDKAVQPVNTYGATKMVMERMFSDSTLAARGRDRHGPSQYSVHVHSIPRFVCVRYGNVIGSTGSVIPLFKRQFAEDGKVTITLPTMTRFWMPVDDAVDLILLAINEGQHGSILVPRPLAMTIMDVAKAATFDEVPFEEIGARPGEKTHETLIHHEEAVRSVKHPGYYELLAVGHPDKGGREAFTVSSVSGRTMTVEEMRRAIADAEEV